jgi:hypothetical protein
MVTALISSLQVTSALSVRGVGSGHLPSSSATVDPGPRNLPSGLRAAITERLGGTGLIQTMAYDGGLHVSESTGTLANWSLVPFALARSGSEPVALHGAKSTAQGNGRTAYRMGALVSWYHSSVSGIEQGFTIGSRPAGAGGSVSIQLHSMGTLTPVVTGSRALALKSRMGRTVLTYAGLSVTDATGRVIPARLRVADHQVRIVIDDAGAVYPVTVDPLLQQAELSGTGAVAGARFGSSIALSASGTVALVGAPFQTVGGNAQQGAAYVFSGTNWSDQTELTSSDGAANDYFGLSVALSASGTEALVGATNHGGTGHANQGEAYVFTGSGTSWSQQAEFTGNDSAAYDSFGSGVALSASGTTALVGAQGHNGGSGAAYLFGGSGTSWAQQHELIPSSPNPLSAHAQFGSAVALSSDGTIALIAASNQQVGSNFNQGSAYLFGASNNWTTQLVGQLTAPGGAASDYFGSSVALSGTGSVALIGSPYHQVGSHYNQGEAWVFSGTDWGVSQGLTSSDGGTYDYFGYSVALSSSGTTALIGAPYHNNGAVYTFGGTNFGNQVESVAGDGASNDEFGWSTALASAGTVSVVGAIGHTVGSTPGLQQGAAYVLVPTPVPANSTISVSPPGPNGTSTVTVQAVDANGNNLTTGGATVVLATSFGQLGPVTDNGNGTYTATLIFNAPGTATVTGTLNGSAIGHTATATLPGGSTGGSTGYWTVANDGGVFSFGPSFYGSTGNLKLNQPVFAITSTADGKGYWFVARDGGVFTYGDGVFRGSVPALGIHVTNIVGMAADTATGGYWLVGSDGGVYAFGAPFDGSVPGLHQHISNIVGMAATADGGGYYLVTSTGAVYAFGDANYQGGPNTLPRINAPIVGMTVDSATGGYWLAGSDGGIYAYGAPFHGSAGGAKLNQPVVGISATTDGSGYYLVASDGGVFSYNAPFLGSMGGKHLNAPMVGMVVAQ